MSPDEVATVAHGLYRIWWRNGGVSIGSVGSTASGARWLAPTNWLSGSSGDAWDAVLRLDRLDYEDRSPAGPRPGPILRPLSARTIERIRAGIARFFPPEERARAEASLVAVEALRARYELCACGASSTRTVILKWVPGVLSNSEPRPDRTVHLCDACYAKGDDEPGSGA